MNGKLSYLAAQPWKTAQNYGIIPLIGHKLGQI